jgi:polymorphic toxin system DSP-PTPase phosphatase-like protein
MNTSERPISESYWVEEGCFLAGEYPGRFNAEQARRRVDALIAAGFNTFIDLTREHETVPYAHILLEEANAYDADIQYHRFAIGDFGLPTPDIMKSILDRIDESLQAGRKVYLHCWGGIGRTGTTVGCYLVRRGLSGNEALRQLADWWQTVPKSSIHPHSPETFEQMTFILNWADYEKSPK